ncbi:UDP-Glycosyltransferase/glycogen phosphorylase [Armillaria gallica]|uniref:UDP-Glycosyltransferase/glycogen phosphorylase n=1 Tax=Armillaria gallica TaxID=47427 RepID=A0A2H3CXC2_ARMGA|nr:UDP-Glycosyltransferase/glycogen phosphorylase [Armillaria gallica]
MMIDFFHPNVGGVENHVYMLSANLIKCGHKVIVTTHNHSPNRAGIRSLLPSPKVYYLPFVPIASSATLPNLYTFLPYLRTILIREHIHLIHAHASRSSLGHEGILYSHLLSVRTVFTDHTGTLRNADAVICVSHTGGENTVLQRELFDKSGRVRDNVYVILNALVPEHFQPGTPKSRDTVTIVVLSRLAYCKGINLLVATNPRICSAFRNVRFVVDRIELLGPIRPNDVCSVLMRGAIFLNTSLTESFGIAILEAACAGPYVVSTEVPEILPKDMISFAEPEENDVFRAISEHDLIRAHERIKTFYDWAQVAERTEVVYDTVVKPRQMELWEEMKRHWDRDRFA